MGNMSNPSINRWGMNLFWYKLWYTDKNYALTLHQDKIFTELVYIFLHYGLLYPSNPFSHKFWYLKDSRKKNNYYNDHSTKYYRIMNFKNIAMGIDAQYTVRIKIRNTYTTKIWLFRFQNWVIINFYCFQPPKKKFTKRKHRRKVCKNYDFYLADDKKNSDMVKRLKFTALYYFSFKNTVKNSYYIF